MTTLMFKFDGIYETGDLAEYIGQTIGIRLISKKPGDVVHGHISQALSVSDEKPDGFTVLTIHFYDFEEAPNWDDETKEGHTSHIKPYLPTDDDYNKLQEAFIKLFNNDKDAVDQLSRDEIAKLLK